MHPRIHAFRSAACVAIALFSITAHAAAQTAKAAGQTGKAVAASKKTPPPLRTPDGQPDLSGYWTNATLTPLERPAELASKEFFTEAEAAAYEKKRLQQENSQAKDDIHYDNVIWQSEKYSKGVSNLRTSLIYDPPDGKIPPLTAHGQLLLKAEKEAERRREAAASAEDRTLAERCISWGNEGPPMLGSTYNANLEILQTRDSVTIEHEIIHGARYIPLDGRPHIPPAIRQLGGDSRGHWEGDTLVIDSTNFTDHTNFRGPPATTRQDIFSDENLHVTERFTRKDADTIVYRFTVDDSTVWTKPWSGEMILRKCQGPILEYACHEGTYGLPNILSAARLAEKAAARK
jgi:hypothetical protein